jgi:geranylgeranyl diphosphate synthase type I
MALDDTVTRKLKESASKVDAFIDELLEPRKPRVLYEASRHLIAAGGKRLRPYLVMKACELVGGDTNFAVPYAAALELLHNFTLVHDDIMDNDSIRRGVQTVHTRWGVPIAIASGDLLFAKVFEAMYKPSIEGALPYGRVVECFKRVTDAAIAICEGQVLDISYPITSEVSEEDYTLMVGGKTSALFKACAEVGAIVGGGDGEQVEKMGAFAYAAGIAFQIVDDVLGVTADEKILGKPVGSDLREGKKTLMVIHALENASKEGKEAILKVLESEDASLTDVETACKVLLDSGSIDYAEEVASKYAEEARTMLDAFPNSAAKRDLLEMVEYFMSRTF